MTPAGPKPKRPRAYQKSGLYGARRALRQAGIKAVDKRTRLGRALREAGDELRDHLGTEPSVTLARSIESVLVCDVLITAGTAAIEELGPIDRRKHTFRPIVRDLLAIMERRRVLCADLGWKRAPKEVPTLAAYLAERSERLAAEALAQAEKAEPAPSPAPEPAAESAPAAPTVEEPAIVLDTPEDRLLRGWSPKPEPPSEASEDATTGAEIERESP